MFIDSSQRPTPPLNGWVQLIVSAEGNYEEVNLDFEDVVVEGGMVRIKCYDTAGNIVYIHLRPLICEAAVFGNIAFGDTHDSWQPPPILSKS